MQIYKYHPANVQPVSGTYDPDSDVRLKDIQEYTRDGLEFTFSTALSGLQETTTNNYNNLYLTKENKTQDILDCKTPKSEYPKYWPTYIKLKDADRFLVTNSSGVAELSGTEQLKDNRYFYELEILDPTYLAVRHFDGTNLKYLTLNQTTSARLTFETRTEDVSGHAWDTQVFEYIIDETNNRLSLFSSVVSGDSVLNRVHSNPSVIANYYDSPVYYLQPATITKTWASETNHVFDLRPVTFAPTQLSLQTTWNSYVSAIEENTLNVDSNNSIQNITNNFLLHTATNNISSNMPVNIIPLKNQLTTNNQQSKTNPYYTSETAVQHRNYNHLTSGTKQETGDESILLGYTSGAVLLTLPINKLTYFTLPPKLTPYTQINVNDARLFEAGAIASDTPLTSDKIFKKLVEKETTTINDVSDGTLLCSWLSGNSDHESTPIWVDRFYNPAYITQTAALTSGIINDVEFVSKYNSITEKLTAQDYYVYDKLSDLLFEPNATYAYYHIGNNDSEKAVNACLHKLHSKDIQTYKNADGRIVNPTYESVSYETHGMSSDPDHPEVMSESVHTDNSVTLSPTYTFNGETYGNSEITNFDGSFCLSFWMYSDDWSEPFADQFIGTYVNNGFGIFNESYTTPFILALDGDKIHLYNTEFEYLRTHFNGLTIKCFTRRGSTENYWFVDDNNTIYEYDLKGVIQNKITSSHLTGKTVTDIEVNDTYINVGLKDTESYFRWDLRNQSTAYIGELVTSSYWNRGVSTTQASSAVRIHTVSKGLSSTAGVILTTPDAQLSQGSTVDNLGNPWVIQNNYLYTYDTTISANIIGLSATDSQTLEGINCDRDGNLWLLYGSNKLAKLDTDRNTIFNISLSSTPLSSARYIDFIHEHTTTGYTDYAVVMNQSVSGAKAIYLNKDGTFKSDTSILTGVLVDGSEAVTRFGTPLSSSSTDFYSWKTITGADNLRKTKTNKTARIDAKVSLTNLYNSSTTTAAYSAYTVSHDLSAMKRGWHHFAINLDAELGKYEMYIDTVKVDSINIPAARFSYSNIFSQPIMFGVSPFFNNITLPEAISQSDRYYSNNIKLQGIKLYNTPLPYYDIVSHFLLQSRIHDVKWEIPVGQRSYIDTVERVFKHRLPGRKSEHYNVVISGLSATSETLKADIKDKILTQLPSISPAYSKLNDIYWDSAVLETTELPAITSVNVLSAAQVSTSSTQVASVVTNPVTTTESSDSGDSGGGGY